MQTVSAQWTAEERDSVRNIAYNLQVSWKKESTLGSQTFTIGVSIIGGDDVIGANPGSIGSPGIYRYFDESEYALSLEWERGLNMPIGGLTKALGEAILDNTTGRFTPRYAGGNSELFTSILPRRPFIINAGFDFAGTDQTIPQFAGILTKQPQVDTRSRRVSLQGSDYVDFFQNRYLDQEVMRTAFRTDEMLEFIFRDSLGMATSQYELDTGINIVPFAIFDKGSRYSDIINELVQAENGHLYQDEEGIFRFENRQHWDSGVYTSVQRVIYTSQVLESEVPNADHIINVVEINAPIYEKQPLQIIYNLPALTFIEVGAGETIEKFFEFQDPVLEITNPTSGGAVSYYLANTQSDGSGTNITSNVSITNVGTFSKAAKYRIQNTSSQTAFIIQLVISGRISKKVADLYYRARDDSSVTAYEERPYRINNPHIQNASWANSLAQMILTDFSDPESLQKLVILAIPELQVGDLIGWRGKHFRIFDIRTKLHPQLGFVQELTILQRDITSYFRIGISTIGGTDAIAP